MKTTIFVLCLFAATSAAAQASSSISGQPQPMRMQENTLHASQHEMGTEQSLLHTSAYSYAKGERPLWELGSVSEPTPLGDVARAYRAEHKLAKKSQVVLEK